MSAQLDQLMAQAANDPDSVETQEWLDALEAVIAAEGTDRAHYLMERMLDLARRRGAHLPFSSNTAYVNTIPAHLGARSPGNLEYEERLRSWMRWNSMAMVVKANRADGDLGGHISSFASLAAMLGTGFNHFWHAPTEEHGGDLLYLQGHSSPGIYARAFLEGRLTEEQLLNFRREVDGKGLSSYPHPKLMPDFWQFPTVSMGLGPLMAIYQARFLKYLHARGIADTSQRKVWAFCGDGEMDEPESMGAISMASREQLDNLIFVVNCNLQRLDGPVRGNGKIIQELESDFRGAGWNVIKVIWGSYWDELLARDKEGILQRVMMETVDGEYQNYKANDGAYVRKHFFGKHPKLLEMVANMSDDDVWRLNRGGHDPHKVYAAFKAAHEHKGQPTVILAKTIKGYGMGKSGEARNTAHQTKKLDDEAVREMRDRFNIPIPDDRLHEIPFFKPADDAPEIKYLHERRKALGGYLPQRRMKADEQLPVPELSAFKAVLEPTAEGREISTTQAYVRIITALLARPEPEQAHRADPGRRVAHLRHGRPVPPDRHLQPARAAVRAGGPRPGDVLPRRQGRPDPAGRHQRSGRHEFVDRRGDLVLEQQPHHDPVLYLLFDVRPAARRRPGLGRRRHARARLPHGRHRRAHHPERRRPAARGWPQPYPGLDHSQLPAVRSDLRPRSGGDHP